MSLQITLAQIKKHSPCADGWRKVLNANGGTNADLNKPFPLSSILDSNGLDDALWALRCLPEYEMLWRKFAWWAATQVADNTTDERVTYCLEVVGRFIEGSASAEELSAAESAAWAAARVAESAAWAVWAAAAESVARAAAESAARAAAWAARAAQENKLREILNAGEWVE